MGGAGPRDALRKRADHQTALRQAAELPVVIERAQARRCYAQMLMERGGAGDQEEARALLAEATAIYRRMGMQKCVEKAEAMPPESA